ncbi:MAG: hypothetical protein AAFV93_24590 [Chloroflexota bacterium]
MGLRSGTCPNCGSSNILASRTPKLIKNGTKSVIGWFIKLRQNGIILRHYTCKDCYLLETYIDDQDSMLLAMNEWDELNTDVSKDDN